MPGFAGLWSSRFDLKGATENEDVLASLDKLFIKLDADQSLRQRFFEYDFRGLGISSNRPFVTKRNPPAIFSNTFLQNHFQTVTTGNLEEGDRELFRTLTETDVFKEDDLVWTECSGGHLTLVSKQQVTSNPRCGNCTQRPSTRHPIFYCNPRVMGVLLSPGKILEPFFLWKLSKELNSPSARFSWGAYIHYQLRFVGWFKDSQEIDILIENNGKKLVVLASINPNDPREKKQFKKCSDLGFKTFFITTKNNSTFEGYGQDKSPLFHSIHLKESIDRLVSSVRAHLSPDPSP